MNLLSVFFYLELSTAFSKFSNTFSAKIIYWFITSFAFSALKSFHKIKIRRIKYKELSNMKIFEPKVSKTR